MAQSRPFSAFAKLDPAFPICLDAAPYSLPHGSESENTYAGLLHSAMCMGVVLYLRPKQHLLVMCSSKINENIAKVARSTSKLMPKNRVRVIVLVHDGIYRNASEKQREDSPEAIGDVCELIHLNFRTAELECVRVVYVFSRVAKKTGTFIKQLSAVVQGHAQGIFREVGLGMPKFADILIAARILAEENVPVRFVVITAHTDQLDDVLSWANARGIHVITYENRTVLPDGATAISRVSTTRDGLAHMTEWAAATASQPAYYAALAMHEHTNTDFS